MFKTISRIKRVCAMILVPRLFRGAGCTPGKFYRLKFDVIRKAKKSTSSKHTDRTKREENKCKKCKKIIDYAFGPAEPYRYSAGINKETHKGLVHVSMCSKTQGPEDERLTHEKDAKIIAEWLKFNASPTQDNNSATLLEDLKSKSLSEAKANVLLRVRNLDTILAAVEKKDKEISTKTAEGKDVNVVLQKNAGEGNEEIKQHYTAAETKERLAEHTASVTDDKSFRLQATSANRQNEEERKLAPKIETISEVPLVEAAPKTDIFNPSKDSILNVTRFEKPVFQDNQSQIYDQIAQKLMQSAIKEVDNHLVKEMSLRQLHVPPGQKILNMSIHEEKQLEPEVIKKESLNTKLNTVNKSEMSTESVDNSQHISSELKIEPIKPAEAEITIDPSPAAQKLVAQVNITADKDIPVQNNLYCEFIGPAYEGRVALRDVGEIPFVGYDIYEMEPEHSQCEHKQPCHLFRKTLIDVSHTTEPRNGLLVREYPMPRKVCFEAPGYMTDPADKRTFDSEEIECQDSPTALHYTDTTKFSTIDRTEDHVHPTTSHVLPNRQEGIINSKEIPKGEESREPTRAAVEMAHTFIQAQPCADPIHERDHLRKESSCNPFAVDHSIPEIDLNDKSVSLTELLRRVRERNRILYCREVRLQMALNPEGKCGDKKSPCPPPQPKCPPPPPPCPPPPPPKCPPPCPPPKSKCPPPKCPPPCPPPPKCAPCPPPKNPCGKKDPCAKFKAQETITLVLHLGPLVNPGRKLFLPVLATNFIPPPSVSEERPVRGFLAKLINQKVSALREIFTYVLEGRPNRLTRDMVLLRFNRARDNTPWTPIPSWPYPNIQRKRPLQCPKDGCPVDPPVNPAPRFQRPCPDKPCYDFPKLQNEESPVLARGFCKTDWTKPKYVTKPYSDVREEAAESPKFPIEDRGALEKSHSLKFVVLRTLLKNADCIKIGVIKEKYQKFLVYIFGWPRPDKPRNLSTDAIYESAKLNATTSKQNEEEKLTQKIEEVPEVPLVEAEPSPDIQNPPETLGPSVMTFENSDIKTEPQMIDDLAKKYLRVVTSREKINEKHLSAQMEQLGIRRNSTDEKTPVKPAPDVINCKPLDDTTNPVQSKFSDDNDRFDTEEPTARKKVERKTKDPHPKGDTMLIDITLFGSACPREGKSILKEAYEISRDSILAEDDTRKNTKTEAPKRLNYTIYDKLPEIKPTDREVSLTELLRRVRERNQILHQRETELQMTTAPSPSMDSTPHKPGCNPPSPHIGTQPRGPAPFPQIQRSCPGKKREPVTPDAPAKKDPCAKCTPVKDPTTMTAAILVAPLVFPDFLPLLMCSISPIISYSASKLSCAKVVIDGIKRRLFGYSESEKQERTEIINVVKIDTKDMAQ